MRNRRRPLNPGERFHDTVILADAGLGGRTGSVPLYQVRCDNGHELTLTKHVILDRGCPVCRKAGVVMPHGSRSTSGVQSKLDALSAKQRQGVERLMVRYLNACKRQGVKAKDVQSAWMEAIDLILRDPDYADTVDGTGDHDDLRMRTRYRQYDPPKDVRL